MLQDCKTGEIFEGTVLITDWKESPFRQKNGTFLTLNCQDRTRVITAKIWDTDPLYITWLQNNDVFKISAAVTEFRGNLELNIEKLIPLKDEEINLEFLLPCSPYTTQQLEERTKNLLEKITTQELYSLLNSILNHSYLGKAYRTAPAALKIHQAYIRGLWEHSVAVAEIALNISIQYPELNRDLLVTGALLHDIGKIYEYDYQRGISATTDGRLLGHIIMGVDLLSREIALIPDFPENLRIKLLHIITSHHGKYEWQSPKRPKLREALIIHYADALEAELWQFSQVKQTHPEEEWSPYIKTLERYVYLG